MKFGARTCLIQSANAVKNGLDGTISVFISQHVKQLLIKKPFFS